MGRTYRCGALSVAAFLAGNAEAVAVGNGQAPFAQQGRVPWRQHAANNIGRQLASSENGAAAQD